MVFQFLKSSYTKLKSSLWRASQALSNKIQDLFKGKIDESTLEKLEEILYEADFGVHIATSLTEKMKQFYRSDVDVLLVDDIQFLQNSAVITAHSGQDLIASSSIHHFPSHCLGPNICGVFPSILGFRCFLEGWH